ncbi:MAG: hypothetical protein MUO26_05675 [Methanotrichaceae archaeon]|nr:hypothetical protein [Methanotrichaceae archaeon]
MCETCRVFYMTQGQIRGSCKHEHLTIYDAYSCLSHDFRMAQKEGTESDRRVCAVENGYERELCKQEINQLDQWKRFASWEIIND